MDTPTLTATEQKRAVSTRLLLNTNLGQISDWVTKIAVGLGIAQFGRILDGAKSLGTWFGDVFTPGPLSASAASAYGLSLVIGAAAISFLMMYMWTATRLADILGSESV